MASKKLIVICSHWFPITAAAGYLEDAARRRDDLRVITLGPSHGNAMPWRALPTVSDKYVRVPDIALPPMPIGDSSIDIRTAERLLGDCEPDLWLTVDSGFRLTGRPTNGIAAIFYTDPHASLRKIYDRHK